MDDDGLRERVALAYAQEREHELASNESDETFSNAADTLVRAWDCDVRCCARRLARALGGSVDDSEDFAQSARIALAAVAEQSPSLDTNYLRRLIRNAVRSAARRDRGRFGPLSTGRLDFEDWAAEQQLGEDLRDLVAEWRLRLPKRIQQVYDLLYVLAYTQRRAASVMNVSQPRVSQLHAELLRRGRLEFADLPDVAA